MPREVVVFDTNAYRSIGKLLPTIKHAERERGICAMVSDSVALELMARFVDDDEAERGRAGSALRALIAHAGLWRYGQMIPFAASPFARSFLPQQVLARKHLANGLSQILTTAFEDSAATTEFVEACAEAATFVSERERGYGRRRKPNRPRRLGRRAERREKVR